ncbi:hypothetical protein COCCADRAFT_40402 [Bipolaris zeicola 26-R-13]|uniref:Uncharacterized protein n=1 Tax=Cochliobolus carbonum (strain 26-R-13) TaxID=930089 RepID=W6XVI6_COCC2|nr:uncharacterized protein COCCADRAFT_40402 [Bipolaris zeicola 26-R-13]EUC29190.1 hypothetical protein COCCADRAFT_40402 [Bipolaris zeicola 26-R-13]
MSNSSFFDFHCPLGGKWYACANGSNFVGCCSSDPCSNGCVQGNIRPAGFNISHYGGFPDASCGSASDFFTCTGGDSFWGCCKSNPCAATPPATCAQGDLVPAFMERPEQFNAYVSQDKKENPSGSGKSNTGAIVGGVVGGVVVLAIIGIIIFIVLRKRKNKKTTEGDMGAATMMPMMNNNEKNDNSAAAGHYGAQSPPPTYSAPIQNSYQATSPGKGHESYHQYASHAAEPQELPADSSSSHNRFSELPASSSNVMDNRRFSELPADAARPGPSELESPYATPFVSPLATQQEFSGDMAKRASRQGLGVSTGQP